MTPMRIGPLARGAFAATLMLVCTAGCSGSNSSATADASDAGTGAEAAAARSPGAGGVLAAGTSGSA